ncbi:tetratricopeptide repeat protein [Bradyrhizobium sp. 31Argb]|uniref:tetratricopeptide repeat protein n=1 Tax=unclassified Bradyrhizobium TaxID=2631580 RepID=UPI00102E2417|nr:tetratricopeptide repeat protein [Bradyrhizobium sp. Leo170]TAI67903.1 hypothetical protein CWO89_00025 [Bradyrhizobium sp. Leo170]
MNDGQPAKMLIEQGRRIRATGDRRASLAAFLSATKSDPSNVIATVESGYDHLHLAQIPQARSMFERSLALDPDNKPALIGLGHTLRHLGEFEGAAQSFQRVLQLEPGHAGANEGLGYALKSLSRNEDALAAFQAAARTNPRDTRPHIEVARMLRDLGRNEEAVTALRDIVAQDPNNTAHLLTLARLLRQTGSAVEALDTFRKLAELDSANLGFRIELGHLLRETDLIDEASKVLEKVLQEAPLNISALNALGWTHRKANSLEAAQVCFERILEIEPTNIGALHALGLVERQRGSHENALVLFTRAKEVSPKAFHIRLEVCHCLRNLKRFGDAIAEFREVLREWPRSREAHLGLGYAMRDSGKVEQALDAFDEAACDDPSHPNGLIEAGHTLLRLGRPAEAEQRFRGALDRSPGNAAALVGLSYALRRLGCAGEAEEALRKVLRGQPGNHGARIALAHLLEAGCRLEEAAELLLELISRQPEHADGLAALGNIRRRQGDRKQALAFFRRASKADPTNISRLTDIAIELRDVGRFEDAEMLLDKVLAVSRADARALLQRGQLLRRQERRSEALAAFSELLRLDPNSTQAMVEAAAEERALGRPNVARQWLDKALDIEVDHLDALLALADIALQSDDADTALALYRRAGKTHPTSVWARLGEARACFELGERDRAFQVVTEARECLGLHPEIAGVEVELLRHMRDWTRAQEVLDDALAEASRPNFWLWSHKVQIATMTGQYDAAARLLQQAPASDTVAEARVALLGGQLAEAQFRYEEAISLYQQSIRLNSGDAWSHFELARAALMNLDVDAARAALGAFIQVSQSSLLLRGQSLSPSQNHVGQLLDEFLLDSEALATLRHIRLRPLDSQFEPLRELIKQYPDYTPAAIIAAIALRQTGQFQQEATVESSLKRAIPSTIAQFWDVTPPEDVRNLMKSWQELHPTYQWKCFDDQKAFAFLNEHYGREIVDAYFRAPFPAQKADIFRLAFLVARGGIYADADDRCLVPVDSFIRPDATLVVHQENYGSIGNNFIAATPEHPVLARALELAAAAMRRGDRDLIWLSTGPGLLTRAFAQEWAAQRPVGLLRRTQVMNLGELQRSVGIHCPVRYKSTELHWSRSAFAKKALRRRG